MEGMSAAEHAMHMGGGGGTTDSTGAAVRNPVHLNPDQERSLGIVYTTVGRSTLTRSIRTVGLIQAPEPNVADAVARMFPHGWLYERTKETLSQYRALQAAGGLPRGRRELDGQRLGGRLLWLAAAADL